jgi:hypothetical protein
MIHLGLFKDIDDLDALPSPVPQLFSEGEEEEANELASNPPADVEKR